MLFPRLRPAGILTSLAIAAATWAGPGAAQPAGRFVTTRDLATLTDIEGLSVSPDGKWAVFQTRRANVETNTYDAAWLVVPTTGGPARRIADGGEPLIFATISPRTRHGMILSETGWWARSVVAQPR
jgi:hypothetical protein